MCLRREGRKKGNWRREGSVSEKGGEEEGELEKISECVGNWRREGSVSEKGGEEEGELEKISECV